MDLDTLSDAWANRLTIATTFITIVIWINIFKQSIFDDKQIELALHVMENGRCLLLPARIRRKNLMRSEVMGILGAIPMKKPNDRKLFGLIKRKPAFNQSRFQIESTIQPEFFENLQIAQSEWGAKRLTIKITAKELEQFDREKLNKICKTQEQIT